MIANAVVLALREIRRNVLRSSLTTLGIVIGVASVIVMVTLGNGATAAVTADIATMGSNLLTLMPGQQRGPGGAAGSARAFRPQDVDALERDLTSVTAVAPIASVGLNAVSGPRNRSMTVTGTTNAYFSSGNWTLARGRWFSDSEIRSGAAVCIIGETTRRELLAVTDPIGERVRLRNIACTVIGLLESKGTSTFGMDRDDTIVMPLRTVQRRLAGSDDVSQIQLSVAPGASSQRAQQDIYRLMRDRRNLQATDDDDFTVFDQAELATAITGTTQTLTALLAAVAAISLLVGGIGIMNIMLVSVTERTREIGIRLAIGAFEGDVLTQFLVEAVVLAGFGGAAGIALALAASAIAAAVLGLPFSVDVTIVSIAFLFSAGVGVVFGFFPARRAASLNPIDALRHE
ncbi:MAG: multidrug ABC transporter substrate-binding protein [Acidobacteria bacterium SCN 69-37]|nr:MAG: multidrug ABC transporter substrate-binding protein [Acidobacteria bacterium SCN 69-37]